MKLSDFGTTRDRYLPYSGGCADCPRNQQGFVPATLEDTEVIVVGEAPGKTEVEQQEGFVGRTGTHLEKEFKRAGVYPYSKTNVVHCHPPGDATPGNKAVNCCMAQHTMNEVEGYPVVVLVGNTAIKAFFPGAKAGKLRGNFLHHPDYPGQRFYCMYHPGYAVRGNEGRRQFRLQVQRLARYLNEDGVGFDIYNGSGQDFLSHLNEVLSNTDTISFDLETDRLESWQSGGHIKSVALTGDGEEALFVHEDEAHFDPALQMIAEWMKDPGHKVIGHNVGFDTDWMEHTVGFSCQAKTLDTMRLFYDLDDKVMVSLKDLVSEYLDGYRHMVYDPEDCDDPEQLRMYNSEDVIYPWRLFHEYITELDDDQLDLYLRVGSPSAQFYRRITSTGIHFNYDEWERAKSELAERRAEELEAWQDEDPDFNPSIVGSYENPSSGYSKELQRYLYDTKDLPVKSRTQKGPSTDGNTIQQLIDEEGAEYLEHLLEVREIDAWLTRYVYPMKRKHVEDDGRIHADYNHCKTDTGRPSSENPNMQNIPRASLIRRMYGAPEGYRFIEADYSQMELRIMFSLANQQNAIEDYNQGVDAHLQTAMEITGKTDPSEITSEERSNAKAPNFGLIYQPYTDDTWRTVQRQAKQFGLDWSQERAEEFAEAFYSRYDKHPELCNRILDQLRRNRGTIKTVVGHKWHYPDWNHENDHKREHVERAVINSHGQGTCAYMTALTGIAMQRYISERGLYPAIQTVNMVHDSVAVQVREDLVPEAVDALMYGRDQVEEWVSDWFKVPLVLDFEMGQKWKGPDWQEYTPEELREAV